MRSTPPLLQPPPPRSGRVATQHCPRRRSDLIEMVRVATIAKVAQLRRNHRRL